MFNRKTLPLPEDRDPLRVMFVITCMPVGGAETLLVNLVRRMDRSRFAPQLCCLKYFGPLGVVLSEEIPAFTGLLAHKYDFKVLTRLTHLLRERQIDAVVTVGTGGDKMFWGRLAASRAGVPVILSALHSTGLPDHVELPNRLLAPLTDGFIGVAAAHGRYLAEAEGCPQRKVFVIPNGVDVERFQPRPANDALRAQLGIASSAPVAGIVAALRPEKNHELFLRVAVRVREVIPEARFLIVGDGPRRPMLEALAVELNLAQSVLFLGTRADIPDLLALVDVHVLTSHMEANPVSILEAMACGKPNVAPRVGSIAETVIEGEHGLLADPGNEEALAARIVELMHNPLRAAAMGRAARERVVESYSLERMVDGYQELIERIYRKKCGKSVGKEGDRSEGQSMAEVAKQSTEY
jgi:glycosyltransferase involved in cell wall biosynthesis